MTRLLIVWHSRTGGARQMAAAAARGARRQASIEVLERPAAQSGAADLLDAAGYLFVCPENLAAMTGLMKEFFDLAYYEVLDRIQGRPYATLICAGSDGSNAARQIERIATGWRLRAIADPLIVCTSSQTPETIRAGKQIAAGDLARCEELGGTLAAGLELGIF